MVLPSVQTFENGIDSSSGVPCIGRGVEGMAGARRPRHKHVEVEFADESETLHVASPVARIEHGGDQRTLSRRIVWPVNRKRCRPLSQR